MKKIALILALCVALSPACLAEDAADRFVAGLSQAWDAFLDMAEEAGSDVSQWAQEPGVTEWVEGKAGDIAAWAQENGLTDWAQDTLSGLSEWFDASGIAEWATGTSQEIQAFIEENRPAIEAWLAEAGQEVRSAWDTLVNADQHTEQEIEAAYETVTESLGEMADE